MCLYGLLLYLSESGKSELEKVFFKLKLYLPK